MEVIIYPLCGNVTCRGENNNVHLRVSHTHRHVNILCSILEALSCLQVDILLLVNELLCTKLSILNKAFDPHIITMLVDINTKDE